MWSATQIPHILRFALAATTGVPESKIRVIAPDVGGGFGGKLPATPEELIAFAVGPAARQAGASTPRPAAESLMAAHHGRDQWQKLTLAAEKDGTVTGLKVELLADLGAYVAIVGGGVPVLGAFMFNAIYKFPAYQFNCQTVLTNKTWTDAYRGAGRPEATFAIERLMDELAVEVGVDPLEIREKNWIKHEEFPFTTVAGLEYDSGNYEAATAQGQGDVRLRRAAGRAEAAPRRPSDPVQLGIGVSTFTEMCGLAPSRVLGSLDYGAGGWEHAERADAGHRQGRGRHRRLRRTARATRRRSARSSPTGSACRSRTSRCCTATPRSRHKGLDTYGSRSLVVGGEALVKAADKVIEKAKPIAAHLLEASVDDIEFSGGRFSVRGTDQGMAIGRDRAWRPSPAHNLPDGVEPTLDSRRDVRPGELLLPARHPPVRDGGRHRDRRGRRCASTSASTTSATSSTR